EFLDAILEFLAPGSIWFLTAGKANNPKRIGQLICHEKMVESVNELAHGKITAGAKDHNGPRLNGFAREIEPANQQFIQVFGLIHACTMRELFAEFNPDPSDCEIKTSGQAQAEKLLRGR